jgi:hypothetical protein
MTTNSTANNFIPSVKRSARVCFSNLAALFSFSYSNGSGGIGATITNNINGALSLDAINLDVGNRVLVIVTAQKQFSGIYVVTDAGSVSSPWVMTRAKDYDNSVANSILNGDVVFCGYDQTTQDVCYYINTSPVTPIVIGTTQIFFTQYTGSSLLNIPSGSVVTNGTLYLGNGVDALYGGVGGSTDAATVTLGGDLSITGTGTFFLVPPSDGNAELTFPTSSTTLATKEINKTNTVKFTASGTYTKPANLIYAIVETWGSGAGGGAGVASGLGNAGGGGAGGYARKLIASTGIGATETVTIGAGGASASNGNTTSFGSLCVAGGGLAGADASTIIADINALGGNGGTGTTGDLLITGGDGFNGIGGTIALSGCGGNGGSTSWGAGGNGGIGGAGNAATAFGAGGGGSGGTSGDAGGAGKDGICIITEYYMI